MQFRGKTKLFQQQWQVWSKPCPSVIQGVEAQRYHVGVVGGRPADTRSQNKGLRPPVH